MRWRGQVQEGKADKWKTTTVSRKSCDFIPIWEVSKTTPKKQRRSRRKSAKNSQRKNSNKNLPERTQKWADKTNSCLPQVRIDTLANVVEIANNLLNNLVNSLEDNPEAPMRIGAAEIHDEDIAPRKMKNYYPQRMRDLFFDDDERGFLIF